MGAGAGIAAAFNAPKPQRLEKYKRKAPFHRRVRCRVQRDLCWELHISCMLQMLQAVGRNCICQGPGLPLDCVSVSHHMSLRGRGGGSFLLF